MADRLNVLLVETDEQTARTLEVYGHGQCRTPTLMRLAAEGTTFENAYTASPVCVPSRVAMYSGCYPHTTGCTTNDHLFRPELPNLLFPFRDAGYELALIGKNHCFPEKQLALFDHVWACGHMGPRHPKRECTKRAYEWLKERQIWTQCWGHAAVPFPAECSGTAETVGEAIRYLDERGSEAPFFLWCSIADPHTPIQAPEPYGALYDPETVELPPWREGEMEDKPVRQQIDWCAMCGDTVTEEVARQTLAVYLGMNTYVDHEVGSLLDALDRLGLSENTLVVYTSDHGDYAAEHKMIRKSTAMYDCLWRVPLLMRLPGRIPAGVRQAGFVSLVDLMPTMLDLCGLESRALVDGRSFAAGVTGEPFDWQDRIFGEMGQPGPTAGRDDLEQVPEGPLTPDFRPKQKLGSNSGHVAAVRTAGWKCVLDQTGERELYDLAADPWELCNLAGDPGHADRVERLSREIREWLTGT